MSTAKHLPFVASATSMGRRIQDRSSRARHRERLSRRHPEVISYKPLTLRRAKKLQSRHHQHLTRRDLKNIAKGNKLMTLPPEVRLLIYEFVLVQTKPIRKRFGTPSASPDAQLLRVSKQMRGEALPIYYKQNVFLLSLPLSEMGSAALWLSNRISNRCQPFRHLRFEMLHSAWKDMPKILPLLKLIQSGTIELDWDAYCPRLLKGSDQRGEADVLSDDTDPEANEDAEESEVWDTCADSESFLQIHEPNKTWGYYVQRALESMMLLAKDVRSSGLGEWSEAELRDVCEGLCYYHMSDARCSRSRMRQRYESAELAWTASVTPAPNNSLKPYTDKMCAARHRVSKLMDTLPWVTE